MSKNGAIAAVESANVDAIQTVLLFILSANKGEMITGPSLFAQGYFGPVTDNRFMGPAIRLAVGEALIAPTGRFVLDGSHDRPVREYVRV